MEQQQYNQWVAALPSLTSNQVKDLAARMKVLNQLPANKIHDGKTLFSELVIDAICQTLKKLNVDTPSPKALIKSSAYVSAQGKMDDLSEFFKKASSKRIVQLSLLKVAVELLYQDMVNWQGVAVSAHTILAQIHRLPAVLNRAFPGYADTGCLAAIVKSS
jgi:hypothetical protein